MSDRTHTERLTLAIEGMTCASCASRVEKRLNGLQGVTATVNLATEQAVVDLDPTRAGVEDLLDAVDRAGYRATLPAPSALVAASAAERPADPIAGLRRRLIASAALSLP